MGHYYDHELQLLLILNLKRSCGMKAVTNFATGKFLDCYCSTCLGERRPVEWQLEMTNVQGDQALAKRQKMLKKFENSSTKTIANQSMSSQTPYLTALRKMISMVLLKHGKDDGIAVYVPKETILKEMAAKIELVKPPFLFLPSLGTFQ
jgi:hypothetical protein